MLMLVFRHQIEAHLLQTEDADGQQEHRAPARGQCETLYYYFFPFAVAAEENIVSKGQGKHSTG